MHCIYVVHFLINHLQERHDCEIHVLLVETSQSFFRWAHVVLAVIQLCYSIQKQWKSFIVIIVYCIVLYLNPLFYNSILNRIASNLYFATVQWSAIRFKYGDIVGKRRSTWKRHDVEILLNADADLLRKGGFLILCSCLSWKDKKRNTMCRDLFILCYAGVLSWNQKPWIVESTELSTQLSNRLNMGGVREF